MRPTTVIGTAIVLCVAGLLAGAYTENQTWSALGLLPLLVATLCVGEHEHSRVTSRR